jgi:hypothetical protein
LSGQGSNNWSRIPANSTTSDPANEPLLLGKSRSEVPQHTDKARGGFAN